MLERRALLETTTGADLSVLPWIKSWPERIQQVPSEEEVMAVDGSVSQQRLSHAHSAPPAASSPGTSWAEAEQDEKRREQSWGEEKETEEDTEEGQKVSGSWKTVRRERHNWKGPKDIKCVGEIFSASLDELSMSGSLSAPYHCIQASLQKLSAKRDFSMNHQHQVVLLQTSLVQDTLWSCAAVLIYITSPLKMFLSKGDTAHHDKTGLILERAK
ncbi:hypothetical protein WISP_31192 [Willisornis vidua]|uniref:Uncharacterized protein n=1 Tax=Willisornis vidua TaxID=1566151 RepID=A0ABQ9DK28_9PASS|nr:hypothetical protein WISP_31192 [Willisornis vidua]